MKSRKISAKQSAEIDAMVQAYTARRSEFAKLAKRVENDLIEHDELKKYIHSTKQREKDPGHLSDKLRRKFDEAMADGKAYGLTCQNMFKRLGDLAGVRLLHIHTEQLSLIHPLILNIFAFHKYKLRERPLVYIWDVERKEFLEGLGLDVKIRPSMYTSVHYVVEPHYAEVGCEIQVRTLAEELWGEVSHTINYPHKSTSVACREQIAVLARLASGCTRLVDSIFSSSKEHNDRSMIEGKDLNTKRKARQGH